MTDRKQATKQQQKDEESVALKIKGNTTEKEICKVVS